MYDYLHLIHVEIASGFLLETVLKIFIENEDEGKEKVTILMEDSVTL
jgi:hypothetical protein